MLDIPESAKRAAAPESPERLPRISRGESKGQTRELYAGAQRNAFARPPYIPQTTYHRSGLGSATDYEDPGDHRNHFLYLQGAWIKSAESIQHARTTDVLQDYVALKFFGTSANVVLGFDGDTPYMVEVTLDGKPVPRELRGADIREIADGKTVLQVNEAGMYRVIEAPTFGGHEMKLWSASSRFQVFSFTFGPYDRGP